MIINVVNNEITSITESKLNRLVIEGATIKYANFSGKGSKYNAEGNRNFEVVLDEDVAEKLFEAGWRIRKNGYDPKADRRRTGDFTDALEECEYRLRVNVNLDSSNPPQAFKKTPTQLIPLVGGNIGQIDYAEYEDCYLEINGYDSQKNGRLSGYLKTIVITMAESRFEELFGSLPIAD